MSLRSSRQRRASLASMERPVLQSSSPEQRPLRVSMAKPVPSSSSDAAASSFSFQNKPHTRFSASNPPLAPDAGKSLAPSMHFPTDLTLPPSAAATHAPFSSSGVRDQTAELASFTFSKPDSFKDLPRFPQDHNSHSPKSRASIVSQSTDWADPQCWDESSYSPLPETILETSEPVTPESEIPTDDVRRRKSSPPQPAESALSSMFRKLSNYGTIPSRGRSDNQEVQSKGRESVPRIVFDEHAFADEQTPFFNDRANINSSPGANAVPHETATAGDDGDQKFQPRKRNHFFQILDEFKRKTRHVGHIVSHPKSWNGRMIWSKGVVEPVSLLPCVFLGVLLNVLDALSYGMILFPLGEPIFEKTGPDGISMFYVSCIVSQLVFSWGGSIFKGAVGSEMIEVVPFFHKMTYTIMARTGNSQPNVVLATVITSYALSSVLTGIVFFTLGALKLGSIVSFFPRHILVGCIGGVGFFLFVTGIEVSARIEGNLEYNLETLQKLIDKDTVALWLVPLALALLLRIATRWNSSPYLVPTFFISVIAIFYIVVGAVTEFNVPVARQNGWIFGAVEAGVPFYHFYSYYEFAAVDWSAVASTIPSMLALTFFGVLHVPINIPALGIAANEDDVNLNRELVAHGISNALSGFCGSIQNYLVYVNSAMFINNGGNSRLAGTLLAAATVGVWVAGPTMIGYVPVMVVGALIFYLGIDLLQEAVYDTWGKMSKLEYATVVAIVLVMGIYDFVSGILVGIVLACLNFVLQNSRKSAIRATYSGEIVESTVRRHPIQRRFLHEVGYQIYVSKLAGFLFFGSIVRVEKQSRALIEEEAFNSDPIRYLVFDLAHVDGLDYTAAEAFGRMERILARRQVRMVISGVNKASDVGMALRNAGVWKDEKGVRFFETLNNALEFCENELLKAFYRQRDALDSYDSTRRGSLDVPKTEASRDIPAQTSRAAQASLEGGYASSPRQRFLEEAATTTLSTHPTSIAPKKHLSMKQPLALLLSTFQELTSYNEDFWYHAIPYFTRHEHAAGVVLFSRGHAADAFYLLEEGMLHAHYTLPMGTYHESIVAGTVCGELPFFSETLRTATVSAEVDVVVWMLSKEAWEKMQVEWPEGAREMLKVAMKLTKERVDAVVAYVLTTAG